MGAFFTNIQLRGSSTAAVRNALAKVTDSGGYISPPQNNWITVYLEETESQDQDSLCRAAENVSKALKTDVIAFTVHDSDIAQYWLYRFGKLADEFNSCPDYFDDDIDVETRVRLKGRAEVLLSVCMPGTTLKQVEEVLYPEDGHSTFAEETISEVARLLGIDEARAGIGFKYFSGEDILPDGGDFEPVGRSTKRKQPSRKEDLDREILPIPDFYLVSIHMLTHRWRNEGDGTASVMAPLVDADEEELNRRIHAEFDKSARDLLKKSKLPGLPTFAQLKAARDAGPDALAALIVDKTPDQLTEIGVGAASEKEYEFLAALLKRGLDPHAADLHGHTVLDEAAKHGMNSAIYRLVKDAAGGKAP